MFFYTRSGNYERNSETIKERPERKVIFEITGDGLTAEEVGRIRQVIRHLNYKRGRRRAPRLFYKYNLKEKEI